jgi:hypothetical protein
VLVFVKGDPKAATKGLGAVFIPRLEESDAQPENDDKGPGAFFSSASLEVLGLSGIKRREQAI